MQKEGMSAAEIIAALAISKATYYRETAAIAARNALEAARDVVEEAVGKVVETAEKALETVLEAAEQVASSIETGKCPFENGEDIDSMEESAINGAVSKNQPYYYERTAEQCRTAMVVSGEHVGQAFGASCSCALRGSVRVCPCRDRGSGSSWGSGG